MLSSFALVAFAALSTTQTGALIQPVRSAHYHWYRQAALPLDIDIAHVAVLDLGGGAVAVDVLASFGVEHAARMAATTPTWYVGDVTGAARSGPGVEALVHRIASGSAELFVSPVFVDTLGGPMLVTRDVFVGFDEDVSAARAESIVASLGTLEVHDRDWTGMRGVWRLRSTSRDGFDVLAAANALAEARGVRFAEVDYVASASPEHTPNDPQYPFSWALNNTGQTNAALIGGGTPGVDLNAPEAWDVATGTGVKVMVMDDGVELLHPDINVGWAQDFTGAGGGGAPIHALDRHGTAVAGCIAGRMDNNSGVVGIAPNSAIAAAKIAYYSDFWGAWQVQAQYVIDALWAAEQINVRVSNTSWTFGFTSAAMEQKFTDTRNGGMVHFAASGNANVGTVSYPAVIGPIHAVGAIDWNGARATFAGGCLATGGGSNWGAELSWMAPGKRILTCDRSGAAGYVAGAFVCIEGTSFASPYAAGVAALILSFNPQLSAAQVETIMVQSSRDLGPAGYDTTFGWGLVDAERALQLTQPWFPTAYCTAGTTTNGCNATMSAWGTPSATQPSGFYVLTNNVEGMRAGLLFYGVNGRVAVPWGGGTSVLCVLPPTQRTPVQMSGGTVGFCDGSFGLDWLAYMNATPGALGNPVAPGTRVDVQAWFRDPAAPGTINLSNALEFVVWP